MVADGVTVAPAQASTTAASDLRAPIAAYLARCRELVAFCSQNGWIDNASIEFDVQDVGTDGVLVAVKFTEVIMKGAGCEARRLPCFGRMRLSLDRRGEVVSATPV